MELKDFLIEQAFCVSQAEVRRAVMTGRVRVNDQQPDVRQEIKKGDVIRVGKKEFKV